MKIENTEVYGFEAALRGSRNPLNSWSKSDSEYGMTDNGDIDYILGPIDLDLVQRLIKAGTEHCKFLRQIQVWCDMDMPRYWWSEFDTYKHVEKNSCSTMHKLLNKDEEIEMHMFEYDKEDEDIVLIVVNRLNEIRQLFLRTKDYDKQCKLIARAKKLLMEGFLQLRTTNLNYQQIRNIYKQRHNHKLKREWIEVFCKWVESLPYSKELITYGL